MTPSVDPTIFHVTHWKAGSQWIKSVLDAAQPGRVVPQQLYVGHVMNAPLLAGRIYPGVYLPHDEFIALDLPTGSRPFVVIRDLRDTLVSWYFSMKISHPMNERVRRYRDALMTRDLDDGLKYLLETRLGDAARIQTSWASAAEPCFRYEDLIADGTQCFARIASYCGIDISRERLAGILELFSFEALSGRPRGVEDPGSHFRKGIAGDWRNYFSKKTKVAFKDRFGQVLIDTGYERDYNW